MSTVESPSGAKKPGGFGLWAARLQMAHGRKLVIALPYLWLILLFMLPFLIVFKISLAEMARAIPPYTELMEWADGQLTLTLNFANFLQLTDDPLYFEAYLGVIDQPLEILHTNLAVYIGIVYAYLPFMVLPIYTALTRIDYSLVEASLDLGARPLKTFFQVIVPLTKGGIIAGSMLVFIPAVGEFVIPELLGGPDSIMIGRVLWQEFFNNRDWPVASAVAIVMLLLLIVPIMWFHKHQQKQMGEQG